MTRVIGATGKLIVSEGNSEIAGANVPIIPINRSFGFDRRIATGTQINVARAIVPIDRDAVEGMAE